MDGNSEHPLTNKAATAEFLRQQNLIAQTNSAINTIQSTTATTTRCGLAQLSTANNVTDVNAYALSATEKNPSIGGSLANQLVTTNNHIQSVQNSLNSRGVYYWNAGENITISAARQHILLVELNNLAPGVYWALGHTYCNDHDVYSVQLIGVNDLILRWITNPRHDGVYDTVKQLGSFLRITTASDTIKLFYEVNCVNSGAYASGAIEAIRLGD